MRVTQNIFCMYSCVCVSKISLPGKSSWPSRLNQVLALFSLSTLFFSFPVLMKTGIRTSPVVQWQIRLPMQGTRVQSLVGEDRTCCGTTKPMHHNCWCLCILEPALCNEKPPQWEVCTLQQESSPRSPQLEKAHAQQWGPSAVKKQKQKQQTIRMK